MPTINIKLNDDTIIQCTFSTNAFPFNCGYLVISGLQVYFNATGRDDIPASYRRYISKIILDNIMKKYPFSSTKRFVMTAKCQTQKYEYSADKPYDMNMFMHDCKFSLSDGVIGNHTTVSGQYYTIMGWKDNLKIADIKNTKAMEKWIKDNVKEVKYSNGF